MKPNPYAKVFLARRELRAKLETALDRLQLAIEEISEFPHMNSSAPGSDVVLWSAKALAQLIPLSLSRGPQQPPAPPARQ